MPYYAVPGFITTMSSSYKSGALAYASGTTKRGKMTEFYAGATTNPNATDCFVQVDISRMTATGSGAWTSWTPTLCDPADGAAVTVAAITATTDPTITASSSLWNNGLNQRNSIRVVFPQESQYLVFPATTTNGLVLRGLSGTFNSSFAVGFTFME